MAKDLTTTVYSKSGKKTGEVSLSPGIFGKDLDKKFLSQTVVALQKNKRVSKAHAKDRGVVSGGGRKPWRQKGTGRARHGSIRSPIWRGGGVTHGPSKDKKYGVKVSSKVKDLSLKMALSEKLRDGEVIVLDKVDLPEAKTKKLKDIVDRVLPKKSSSSVILILAERDEKVLRAVRNLPGTRVAEARDVSVLDVLSAKYAIFEKEALDVISKRMS